MRRRFAFAAALLAALLGPAQQVGAQDASLGPIVGNWDHHGFFVTVNDDGSSTAVWRVYRWCDESFDEPCDQIVNNAIISGGHAVMSFTARDDSGAFQGQVLQTTDPEGLDLGPVSLMLQPYDMAILHQGDFQLTMCGEDAQNQAPSDVLEQCGA